MEVYGLEIHLLFVNYNNIRTNYKCIHKQKERSQIPNTSIVCQDIINVKRCFCETSNQMFLFQNETLMYLNSWSGLLYVLLEQCCTMSVASAEFILTANHTSCLSDESYGGHHFWKRVGMEIQRFWTIVSSDTLSSFSRRSTSAPKVSMMFSPCFSIKFSSSSGVFTCWISCRPKTHISKHIWLYNWFAEVTKIV